MSETDTVDIDDEAMVKAEAARNAQVVQAMKDAGESTDESSYEDYFGFSEDHKVVLPDGKSFVIHSSMNEGARRQYLNAQNRDVTVERVSGNAKMKVQQGEERHALLQATLTGWSLHTRSKSGDMTAVPFTNNNLNDFLKKASPKVIDLIEKDVRKHNPWLMAGATADDIRKQITELEEMLEAKIKEEAGNDS